MATIALEGMRFFAYHGLYAEEQQQGNHFIVDVWLDLPSAGLGQSDEINSTVDYSEVYSLIKDVMDGARVNLLERLMHTIGKGLLDAFPPLYSARVRVSKMNPPLGGECARSYLEDVFRR